MSHITAPCGFSHLTEMLREEVGHERDVLLCHLREVKCTVRHERSGFVFSVLDRGADPVLTLLSSGGTCSSHILSIAAEKIEQRDHKPFEFTPTSQPWKRCNKLVFRWELYAKCFYASFCAQKNILDDSLYYPVCL